jgi:DNA-binding transcriptional LysR family regulator
MNIAGVDLNLLTAFDALMKYGAVTTAAARIGRSQPAMSHALRRLRELFDDELFVRAPGGVRPTARAHALAAHIAPALEQIGRALEARGDFEPGASDRAFVVGMSEYAEIALVGALAQAFRARAPRAHLRVVPVTRADYVARLDAGKLDLAVGNLNDPPSRFARSLLFDDPLVCVARAGHPALARRLSLRAYARALHVLVSPTGEAHGPVDRLLAAAGLQRRIAVVVGTYLAVPLVLTNSDLIATMPARPAKTLEAIAGLAVRALPLREVAAVAMIWHRRDDGDPAHAWFRGLLAEACAASVRRAPAARPGRAQTLRKPILPVVAPTRAESSIRY